MTIPKFQATGVLTAVNTGGSNPTLGRVQGINATLDDLLLADGSGFSLTVGHAISDATLTRDIEGASKLDLTCHDPERSLLQHPLVQNKFDVQLDGLRFSLVKLSKSGDDVTLTFEDKEVSMLRGPSKPKKAPRKKVTRAEFIRSMVREVKKPYRIPFWCPQLHKKQPIGTSTQVDAQAGASDVQREPGITNADASKIKVKGDRASPAQIRILNDDLKTGDSMGASEKVLIASVMTMTQESNVSNISGSGGYGPFSQLKNGAWPASGDTSKDAAAFFRKAIQIDKSNSGISPNDLCQKVQASGNPRAYAQWEGESRATVAVYLHGSTAGAGATATSSMGAHTKYMFKRKRGENTWDCSGRLAEEVGWRRFVVAGIFYYASEDYLFRSKSRMHLMPGAEGFDDLDFDIDVGQPVSELTVEARTSRWSAPPGTCSDVSGYGVADGKWLLTQIETSLFEPTAHVTFKKPITKLPEPPAGTRGTSRASASGAKASASSSTGNTQVAKAIAEMDRIDKLHLGYVFGGSHGSGKAPANGPFDCSSAVSRILEVVGVLGSTQTTVGLASWGSSGEGSDFTVWVKNGGPGGGHTFISVKVNGQWKCWGTSQSNPGGGPGWHYDRRGEAGFGPRHHSGL